MDVVEAQSLSALGLPDLGDDPDPHAGAAEEFALQEGDEVVWRRRVAWVGDEGIAIFRVEGIFPDVEGARDRVGDGLDRHDEGRAVGKARERHDERVRVEAVGRFVIADGPKLAGDRGHEGIRVLVLEFEEQCLFVLEADAEEIARGEVVPELAVDINLEGAGVFDEEGFVDEGGREGFAFILLKEDGRDVLVPFAVGEDRFAHLLVRDLGDRALETALRRGAI